MAEPAFRVSLRTKWTLALVATALGPLLLVGVATLKLQRDGLMDAEKDLQAAVAMQTGKSVGFAVSDVSDTSHRVGRLLTSATSQSERDPEAGAALIQLAKAEVEGCETLAALTVYDKDGAFVDAIVRTAKGGLPAPVEKQSISPAARADATRQSGSWQHRRTESGGEELAYVEALKVQGLVTGYLRASVVSGSLSRLVGLISEERFRGANAVFIVLRRNARLEWRTKYDFSVKLGVGVTSGEALVGNLGSETRMEVTLIGDTVNTAARLQSMAQASQTLVTAEVATNVSGFDFRSLGRHPVRGKREAVELFELVL